MTEALLPGPDGAPRCWWCTADADYVRYHDEEWGYAVHDDRELFEKLCLEGFQAGLSWRTILRKRDAFRDAFAGFEPKRVAAFGRGHVERLMQNPDIVRNRAKIEATIANAQAAVRLAEQGERLTTVVWAYAPAAQPAPTTADDIPANTPESTALSADLRSRGFRFVGPTTVYAFMQAMGLVNDHIAGCAYREAVTEAG